MTGGQQLVRGQRLKVAEFSAGARLEVVVSVRGQPGASLRFLCLLVGADDHLVGPQELLFEGKSSSSCGSVTTAPVDPETQVYAVDLDRLPPEVTRLVFAVGLADSSLAHGLDLGSVTAGFLSVRAGALELAHYAFRGTDFAHESAICVGEMYRKEGWRVFASGSGFRGGLAALGHRYKVASELMATIETGEKSLVKAAGGVVLPPAWPGGQSPALPQSLLEAVGLVVVTLKDGGRATGTGFAIGPGGHILTCFHVVEGATSISIALGGSTELRPLEVLATDATMDLALLRLTDNNGSAHWLLLAALTSAPSLGQAIGLLGYPMSTRLGLDINYSQGIINSLRKLAARPVLQLDAGAAPGSSGGPVFDRTTGRVLGVLTSGIRGPETGGILVNFAIDIRALWPLKWLRQLA